MYLVMRTNRSKECPQCKSSKGYESFLQWNEGRFEKDSLIIIKMFSNNGILKRMLWNVFSPLLLHFLSKLVRSY